MTAGSNNFILSLRTAKSNSNLCGAPTYIRDLVSTGDTENPYSYQLSQGINKEQWVDDLASVSADGPVVVFIHGYHNLADKAVTRYLSVKNAVTSRLPDASVVCFDWPSTDGQYSDDQKIALQAAPLLIKDCLKVLIAGGISASRIQILTHSMGGYLLQNAFCGEPDFHPIANVMMAEADVLLKHFSVPSRKEHSALSCFLMFTKHLTVYNSECDLALKGAQASMYSHFPLPCQDSEKTETGFAKKRLGMVGLKSQVLASEFSHQLSNVNYTGYYNKVYASSSNEESVKQTDENKVTSDIQDSHVWPVLGTSDKPQKNGDPFFMDDLVSVISAKPCIHRNTIDPNQPNNFTFNDPLTESHHISEAIEETST